MHNFLYIVGFNMLTSVEDFCTYVHLIYQPIIFFACTIFVWILYQDNAGSVKRLQVFPLLFFWESLRRINTNSLNVGRVHKRSHLVLDLCLLGGFSLLIQSPYQQLVCSDFLFLHDSVLVDIQSSCMFLGIYPFLLQSNLLVYNCLQYS